MIGLFLKLSSIFENLNGVFLYAGNLRVEFRKLAVRENLERVEEIRYHPTPNKNINISWLAFSFQYIIRVSLFRWL